MERPAAFPARKLQRAITHDQGHGYQLRKGFDSHANTPRSRFAFRGPVAVWKQATVCRLTKGKKEKAKGGGGVRGRGEKGVGRKSPIPPFSRYLGNPVQAQRSLCALWSPLGPPTYLSTYLRREVGR